MGKKGVFDSERLGTHEVDVHGALQLWTEDLCGWGPVGAATRDGRLGPFKAALPLTKPRPLRRRTCIIESTFQYLFTLLLLWVAITVYIICLSVLTGRCSLLAEWLGGGRGINSAATSSGGQVAVE